MFRFLGEIIDIYKFVRNWKDLMIYFERFYIYFVKSKNKYREIREIGRVMLKKRRK